MKEFGIDQQFSHKLFKEHEVDCFRTKCLILGKYFLAVHLWKRKGKLNPYNFAKPVKMKDI